MKFAQIAIGSILLIEGILLLYSPQERYNFHAFAEFIKTQFEECGCLKSMGYACVEKVRFFVVALILSGGFSLTFGNNIIVGIIAQLLWTVTQSQIYHEQGLSDIRNSLVQILFFIILLNEFGNEWKECKQKREAIRRHREQEEKKKIAEEEASVNVQPKTEEKKKVDQGKKSQEKLKQKEESKKSK